MNNIGFTPEAWEDYTEWEEQDMDIVDKINELIKDIRRNGVLTGKGKPERLKHMPAYSRRITKGHRLIYIIDKNVGLVIYSCKGHYDD
ncbi:MAG: Txe/YoeB family addiction module toxin [Synergistaceae bacterium]|nr:Txe/YoeB family addiction module toxin [Synergistaceae bacterium]MBQ6909324.1 Txe/YoeB family addiction module toxin [Synergistaceae bacterium]MBQ9895952.1 Txe/YoeB family addiction module toxin [Synergistaceae bacterium]MBR0222571.1 Txe/YoeB family addiction module toxin [Synergistaceae bacterium]